MKLRIFDNPETIDRYTVVDVDSPERWAGENTYFAIGFSEDCYSPGGFSQCCVVELGEHLGQEISFNDLDERVRKHILGRFRG